MSSVDNVSPILIALAIDSRLLSSLSLARSENITLLLGTIAIRRICGAACGCKAAGIDREI